MEESIENIWKKGFVDEASSIPRIDNLNSLKSIYFMDKLKRRYRVNVLILMLTAIMVLFAFILGGVPFIGLFMFTLFAVLALLGKIEINKLDRLDKGSSNFEYVKSIDDWLKNLLAKFALVYRIWVPLLFIGFSLAILRTNLFVPFIGETLLERLVDSSSKAVFMGLPFGGLMIILTLAIILSYFSGFLFKKEIKSIYGDLIGKLDELLVDFDQTN